ncbi:MAG: bifunctional DNA primase/polymerase [Geminicoccaceae bacterium]
MDLQPQKLTHSAGHAAPGRPFAEAAVRLAALGLAVVPTGGPDGKRPHVRWGRIRSGEPPGQSLINKYADANIAVICNASNVVVVDVDDPEVFERAVSIFGESPIIIRTPRGGVHLWYRWSGEKSANLRCIGLDIDVKAARGLVLVPPSRGYSFAAGSWGALKDLPRLQCRDRNLRSRLYDDASQSRIPGGPLVPVGQRNDQLFRACLRWAHRCDSLSDLEDVALTANDSCLEVRLPDTEVRRVAASAWS